MTERLIDKYRPQRFSGIVGHEWAVEQLTLWAESPTPTAFVFSGPTGTGKTSAALALARELGVNVEAHEFGGLHEIASGEQTGESVRRVMRQLHLRPMSGSGWQVLVVNEADALTPNAAYVWLDVLENLPARCCVIFTTNAAHKLPRRLLDRCEHFAFDGSALLIRPALETLAARVWATEVGGQCPDIDTFGPLWDENGDGSFRRLLQLMEPAVRAARHGLPFAPKPTPAGPVILSIGKARSAAAKKAWATRRAKQKKATVKCG